MNAELIIKTKSCDEDIFDFLFAEKGEEWYVVHLVIDGRKVSSIVQSKTDVIHEIFDIDEHTDSFDIDHNRLNYLLHKYRDHHKFVDLKKILRPIVRYGVSSISLKKMR
jgi:hypothetical protein